MWSAAFLFAVFVVCNLIEARPTEQERVQLWYEAGNTWPPNWQPESDSMKETMRLREEELLVLPGADERWENWMQYTQGRMAPRFTPVGFKLISTPPAVHAKLKAALDRGLLKFEKLRNETQIDAVYTPIPSKFVDLQGLEWEILEELRPLHEEWSGLKLKPSSAYGIRLYRNGSSLVMHYDKIQTHVISCIIHVGHEYDDDNNPWPIEIEDHNGVIHAVNLEAGQMLFYESASCVHGRREIFRGKYYAGIFIHYQPVDKSIWDYTIEVSDLFFCISSTSSPNELVLRMLSQMSLLIGEEA
jgi:hypothetical protein